METPSRSANCELGRRTSPAAGVSWIQQFHVGGFTLFEFAVVASIFAILVTVLLNRIAFYQDAADDAAMRSVVGTLRSALAMKVGELQARGQRAEVIALHGQNPMLLLSRQPENYVGEYYKDTASQVGPGVWYFDRSSHSIVYVSRKQKSLAGPVPVRVCFRVESLRLPTQTAKPTGASDNAVDAVLNQVDG